MKNFRLKIFCDFDGTVTANDVYINSLGRFISRKKELENICEEYYSERINSKEYNLAQLELVEEFCFNKFDEYLDEEKIDEYFKVFLDFCTQRNYEVFVLSGGFDYYIDYILKKNDCSVKYFSTTLIANEEAGQLSCEFPYTDEYCRMCDTCKRNILINNTVDHHNEISVYIGDSLSDYCVSGFADVVFAKGKLASYCWKNNITYYEYKTFLDIINKIKKLSEGNKFKQRQEAVLRRKDVLKGG